MNVLMLTSEFPPALGGVGSHVFELSRALMQLGHQVTVIAPVHNYPQREYLDDVLVYRPRLLRGLPFYDWHLWAWMRRHIADLNPDIVHVHGLRPLWAAAKLPCPLVFTNHTSGFLQRLEKSRPKQARALRRMNRAACLIAPSQELVDGARAIGYNHPSYFIANGVDDRKFLPEGTTLKAGWDIPDGHLVVLMARRLVEKNGVIYFAQAAGLLKDYPVTLVIAGEGDQRDKVEHILKDNGMYERTRFLGGIPNPQMPDVYRAADISVLPSLMEATSIAALEAMACGIPVVATEVGGLPALVDDGNTGLLVAPKSPHELAAAIIRLIADEPLRQRMGLAARARVEREFSWRHIAGQTLEVYRQALEADR